MRQNGVPEEIRPAPLGNSSTSNRPVDYPQSIDITVALQKAKGENPEAAIEAASLTSSDPNQVLGTGHKGHWPPTMTNSTLECLGKAQPPPTGERGSLFLSRKTRPICPSF